MQTIRDLVAGKITPRPQPAEGASHARKITREDGRLDWTQPARALWNRMRAFTPWPGAFTHLPGQPQPHLLKIWQAEVATQSGRPGEILPADKNGIVVALRRKRPADSYIAKEGGRRMTAQEFLAGHHLKPGDKLG